MRRGGRIRRLAVGLAVLVGGTTMGMAAADELETEAALQEWIESPLDLGTATAEEIALLPWVSPMEAVAITTLVALGELHRGEDFERIPGFTRQQREAITPYVRLPSKPGAPLRWQLVRDTRLGAASPAQWTRLRAEASRWTVGGRDRQGGTAQLSFLGLRGPRWDIGFGRWRPRSSSPLLLADATSRTRSAPMPDPKSWGPTVSPSLSSVARERAWTLGWQKGVRRWRIYHDPVGATTSWMEFTLAHRSSTWSWALAQPSDGRAEFLGQWRHRSRGWSTRIDLAGRPSGWRSFAQMIWNGRGHRLGISLTRSEQSTANARDPISMQRLDRPHHSAQIDLRLADERWRWVGMLRRIERDGVDSHRLRTWLQPRARSSRPWRWQLRLGLDEAPRDRQESSTAEGPQSSVDFDLHFAIERGTSTESRRLRLWWRGQRGASVRAVAVDLRRGGRWLRRATVAGAAGTRSMPWAAGLPAGGLRVRWIRPGEGLLLLAASRRWQRTSVQAEFGAWVLFSVRGEIDRSLEGGWALRVRGRPGAKVAR